MERLSLPISTIGDHYDVVVVGSGYGGGVAASRMARAGLRVCLLERGRELQPGEYPDALGEAAAHAQVEAKGCRLWGQETDLFDLRLNDDIHALVGSGLGGTSLINASVAEAPDPRLFDDPVWPRALREDQQGMQAAVERAKQMLGANPYPDTQPTLAKFEALRASAESLGAPIIHPDICVNFSDGVNRFGVQQNACTLCGDCVSGCNEGAKNTTLMNYLPDARRHGAEIFCEVAVRYLSREGDGWRVHFEPLGSGRDAFEAPLTSVRADQVFLAAGSLGSTEILLRSREKGLLLSPRLGERFTSNGDVLGFGYNGEMPINGIGRGSRIEGEEPVGPCITGLIDMRQGELEQGMVIEEGTLPSAMAGVLPGVFCAGGTLLGSDTDGGLSDEIGEGGRAAESLLFGSYRGAVAHSQTYLVMAHDNAAGRLYLQDDHLRIEWPGVGEQPVFQRINERLQQATAANGGTYIPNPMWHPLLEHDLITVHPLGGAVMGESAESAVVDDSGAVFRQGEERWPGLYVMDGAIIPRSLGINPLLTITALAERACGRITVQQGLSIDYESSGTPWQGDKPQPGIAFTERMAGQVGLGPEGNGVTPMSMVVTVSSSDLQALLEQPEHQARLYGTLEVPGVVNRPLQLIEGQFNLFTESGQRVETRNMLYRATAVDSEGNRYRYEGRKVIHDDPGFDMWADTTTLFATLTDEAGRVVCQGELHIAIEDFAKQLTTMRVTGVESAAQRLQWLGRFGRFFAGNLFDQFGGVVAPLDYYDFKTGDGPGARRKRPLRLPSPSIHSVETDDRKQLRLTRYRGGELGPVLLSHGLGVSSRIFTLDSVETNLTEYLVSEGYDVWLLDYRASIELPSARSEIYADQIALFDYPSAVAEVRRLTGRREIDLVAHCYGAATLAYSLLLGLKGVRSVLFSQVAMHMRAPLLTKVKAWSHLPTLLMALGVENLTARTGRKGPFVERLLDQVLRPQLTMEADEKCRSAVCHRISFLYGLLYEHRQLAPLTHDTLYELFGVASMSAMAQLAAMVRHGSLVDATGKGVLDGRMDHMDLPITFIHGSENRCYLPEGSALDYEILCERYGNEHYRRYILEGYGHIDSIMGKDAARDVYPIILEHLQRQQ